MTNYARALFFSFCCVAEIIAFTMKLAGVIETHEHAGEFKDW